MEDLRYRVGGVELAARHDVGDEGGHLVVRQLGGAEQAVERAARLVLGDLRRPLLPQH